MNAFATSISTLQDGPRQERPEDPPRPTSPTHDASFADQLLAPLTSSTWQDEAKRLGVGLGLGALFGGAIGLRQGGASILLHALGVPAGLIAVAGIAVPAFAIVLGLANAPIDAMTLGRATTRAAAKAGLVLGGLAPAAALYVVTVEDAITVTMVGFGGLLLAGVIAMRSFARDLRPHLDLAPVQTRRLMQAAMPAFLAFAALLAARVWWLALPLLTGAR